jgi:hypothetical protein
MPVTPGEIEDALRAAIQVTHISVEDNSGSCGNNYFVLIVSKVSVSSVSHSKVARGGFIQLRWVTGDLSRTLKGRRRLLGTRWVPYIHPFSFVLSFFTPSTSMLHSQRSAQDTDRTDSRIYPGMPLLCAALHSTVYS